MLSALLPLWAESAAVETPHEVAPDQMATNSATFKQVSSIIIMNEPPVNMHDITKLRNRPQPRGPQQMYVKVWRSMSLQQPPQGGIPQGGIPQGSISTSAESDDESSLDGFLLPDGVLPQVIVPTTPTIGGNSPNEEEVGMNALPMGPACMEVSHSGTNHVMTPLQVAPAKNPATGVFGK